MRRGKRRLGRERESWRCEKKEQRKGGERRGMKQGVRTERTIGGGEKKIGRGGSVEQSKEREELRSVKIELARRSIEREMRDMKDKMLKWEKKEIEKEQYKQQREEEARRLKIRERIRIERDRFWREMSKKH